MAIRNPTTLVINTSADINIDLGNGAINTSRVFNNKSQVGFSSYSTGSLDINDASGTVDLGKITTGVFLCNLPLDFQTSEMTQPLSTKLFAYDGISTSLSVSSQSANLATMEYVLGSVV